MDAEQQLCGAEISVDWNLDFECELAPGHAGDHETTYTWPNEPIGPQRPQPPPAPNRFLPSLWGETLYSAMSKTLTQHLDAAANGSPFVNPDAVARQVMNRDLEG